MTRRVVVSGIGAVTPIGSTAEGLWAGVRRGESGVGRLTRFDPAPFRSKVAAEVTDFDPLDYMDTRRARRLDRFSQFGLAASIQALADAGLDLDPEPRREWAVYLGSALGGVAFSEEQHTVFLERGLAGVNPMLALSVFAGAAATNASMQFGLTGPAIGNANSCASGAMSIGEAFRLISSGTVDVALAGGVEAALAPLTFGAFSHIRALSTHNDDPARASRPFDSTRNGFVMAEGAAVLVLEDEGHALARGARPPYAEIVGYGTTNDAYHMTAPLPSGQEAARAMTLALADARIPAHAIDYVNAHATSTPLGDVAETLAVKLAFESHAEQMPISSTKALYGHSLGASGAIEAAITALALQRGWLPPTVNLEEPDPACALAHLPPGGKELEAEHAMSNSFGFGGFNASLILRRCEN